MCARVQLCNNDYLPLSISISAGLMGQVKDVFFLI